ncbi:Beta-glucosidase [Saliniradius amylolyticus]|uniref:Beta-glucosidase n=1 Tax=Saliniradius amylolyticus TaxID=2183582 RepID=A0A2S2E300_9ALTE|nr:GH1 family beta-glucosidase [Saliniradius amylolyticus]AWL11387.1 Beta-glucosidase [Saliniradius amylolyticus]
MTAKHGLTLPSDSSLMQQDFVFGVATSSFQIEGARDGRLPCIWDTFCQKPGTIKDASNGDIACQHVELWLQDVELIKQLNVDAYRLSISWPRVIHESGEINEEGLNFYHKVIDALNEAGIQVFVTLYHWDLPQHLEDQGGWCNRATAYAFRDYADRVSAALGEKVHAYSTLNEPFCSAYLGYELGIHAPGIQNQAAAKAAAHHLMLAHGLAMPVLRKNCPGSQHGIVVNISPIEPYTNTQEDIAAAETAHQYLNAWYIDPILKGQYPDVLEKLSPEARPPVEPGDMDIIAQPIDYLGVNYYTRERAQACSGELFRLAEDKPLPLTDMGWEVYPQGLYNTLTRLNKEYLLPPLYITENGAAMKDELDNGRVRDTNRIDYFQTHLNAVDKACRSGVNIAGYFAWSLMDNFEWAEGYLKRFGIVYVDYTTQERILKDSAKAYSALIASRTAG